MVDTTGVVARLRDAGIPADFSRSGMSVNFRDARLYPSSARTTPSEVLRRLRKVGAEERVVIAEANPSQRLRELARHDGRIVLVGSNEVIADCEAAQVPPVNPKSRGPKKTGPKPYSRFAVIRALLAFDRPAQQTEIAEAAGVNQSAVSRALRGLGPLVYRKTKGWVVADRAAVFDLAAEYPGPGGSTAYWWSSDDLKSQWEKLSRYKGVLLSGDLAAESYRGWRRPERVIAYARAQPDLSLDGFVMADADDYTLAVTVPADPTVFSTAESFGRAVADPVVVAMDIRRTGTTGDEYEAAEMLRRWVELRTADAK